MFVIILILSIFILLIYNYYVHYGRNGRLLNLIPGPLGLPIVGNLLQYYVSAGKYKISNIFTLIDLSFIQVKIHESFILEHIFIKIITYRLLIWALFFALTYSNQFFLSSFICLQRI